MAHGLEVPVQRLIADGVPRSQWPEPARLPPWLVPVMSDMYRSLSEAWTPSAFAGLRYARATPAALGSLDDRSRARRRLGCG